MNKNLKSILALALCVVMVAAAFTGCQEDPIEKRDTSVTYNTTTSTMPSNWNEMTYADNNDTQIMSYIGSSFFEYDYKFEGDKKFNDDGSINKAGIVAGAYTTNYSAATKLEDVTATVDAKWGYTDEQKTKGGYAWKITLRDDLKWDDGTPIKAADFVYTMQQQLDPLFMNFRANTYYDTLMIKNSKTYYYNGTEGYAAADSMLAEYDESKDSTVIWKMSSSSVEDAVTGTVMSSLRAAYNSGYESYGMTADQTAGEYLVTLAEAFGAPVEVTAADIDALEGKTFAEIKADATLKATFDYLVEWWGEGDYGSYAFAVVYYKNDTFAFEDVGIYSIDEENAIVVCLDIPFAFLNEDGSLSYLAAYYMSSLPLVHKEKYEASKIAPAEGATLWTSNYNSSLETTASWGPYKLVEFEAGSHYKLVKNENWYGYSMETNKGQYNVDTIFCRKVEEFTTQWMGFLAGQYDDSSLQTENVEDYVNSKYVYYTSNSTGTYGMQLFSDLSVLKNSDNNNGILAILEFRQAFNLALNRSDVVEKIWPGSTIPCFGLVNVAYYYDIENSATLADGGQYRNTAIAKAGILRAYGFVEENGKWSSGELKDLSLDEAYESLTGYNPVLAKEKLVEAIEILTANAEEYGYDASKNITLVYGSSVDNAKQRERAAYIQTLLDDLSKGTALEDKIDIVFDASAGSKWSDAFRSGDTQIGFGYGFTGNPFNPFDIIGGFVNPGETNLNYHTYWDTSVIDLTLTLPEGDYEGAGETITMSVLNWYFCLNGLAESEGQAEIYNWGAGYAPVETRLTILSALEELVIKESRSVMLIAESGGSFLGAKFSYFSDVDNVFMGFGGIRYLEVNYNNADWADYVKANNNNLEAEYKKSE